ncbi:MAG: hypothetical protein GX061_05560 [Eubacteriaceae bacterium]|nr:hypothetical protein [Eubacteriaceae bacterium]
MIWSLIKVRFLSYLHSMFNRKAARSTVASKGGKGLMIGAAAILLYLAGALYLMFSQLFTALSAVAVEVGAQWMYFSSVFIGVFGITLLMGTLVGMGTLYSSKDNDLLLSMPIPPSYIIISRILYVALWCFAYALTAAVAGLAVYPELSELSPLGIVIYVLTMVMTVILSLSVSMLLGKLFSSLAAKTKGRTFYAVAGVALFMVGYFYLISEFNKYLESIIMNFGEVARSLQNIAPLRWLGEGVSEGNFLYFIFVALCAVIPFFLSGGYVSKTFLKTAAASGNTQVSSKKAAKDVLKEVPVRMRTPMAAFVSKELSHFGHSAGYIVNSSLGVLMLLAAGIGAVLKRDMLMQVFAALPGATSFMAVICSMVLCAGNAMIFISAPSVSIEGKNIWVALCLPVEFADVLMAKVIAHLVISMPPTLIGGVLLAAAFNIGLLPSLLFILAGVVYGVWFAMLGVLVNLKFPRLDYLNETYAVKQGLPTLITMLIGFVSAALPGGVYLSKFSASLSPEAALGVFIAFFAGMCVIFYKRIVGHGAKVFGGLG